MSAYRANGGYQTGITRRDLIATSASLGAAAIAGSAFAAARRLAPSDRVNIAVIGAGGQGSSNMSKLTSQNIVCTTDVDYDHVLESLKDKTGGIAPAKQALKDAYDKATRYTDYRKMFDAQKDIDAVLIATPRRPPCHGARPSRLRPKTAHLHNRGEP
jgi:hypothetical protein